MSFEYDNSGRKFNPPWDGHETEEKHPKNISEIQLGSRHVQGKRSTQRAADANGDKESRADMDLEKK